MRTPTPILLAPILALLFAGCQKGPTDVRAAGERPKLESKTVTVATAGMHALPRSVHVSGTLAPDEEAELGFKIQGRVASVRVDLGSRVKKGDLLATLETADLELRVQQAQAALQQARARLGLQLVGDEDAFEPEQIAVVGMARSVLDEAKLNRDRIEALVREKLRSDSDLDTARAAYEVARARHQDALEEVRQRQAVLAQRRAELAIARQQLSDAALVAPFDGAIRERHLSPGHFVAAGASLLTIVKTHPLRLRLPVPERESIALREGQPVSLRVDGDTTTHTGRITRLAPALGEANRTLAVEAEVANPEGALRAGSFARAEILVEAAGPALCVPKDAVITFAGIEKVIVAKESKEAQERRIRTGRSDRTHVEILEGLKEGELVVLAPGALVTGQPLVIGK